MGCLWIERHLIIAFDGYGRFVCRHPAAFLLIPLIFGAMVAAGLMLIKMEVGVVMLFTPSSAPSRREQVIAREFISVRPIPDNPHLSPIDRLPYAADDGYVDLWFNVQVAYKDRRNLMTPEPWYKLAHLMHHIYQDFTCSVSNDPHAPRLRYNPDFCNPQRGCLQMEEYVTKIADILNTSAHDKRASDRIQLSYPVMYVYNKPYNWAPLIYGVTRNETSGILESARAISLFFQFQYARNQVNMPAYAQRCMQQMTDYLADLRKQNWGDGLECYSLSERLMDVEVMKTKSYALPYLALTIGLIMAFTVGSSIQRGFVCGSAFEALMGVLTIGLSLLASFGFLFICGRFFNAIVIIAPFLVMCVGIDNDFLLMAAYRQTNPKWSPDRRLGAAFSAAGPSLTITSITDILCFGIGFISDTPSVANFCLYTSVSLTFRYIYQLTFFAAIMAYVGRMEARMAETHEGQCRVWFQECFRCLTKNQKEIQKPPLPVTTPPSAPTAPRPLAVESGASREEIHLSSDHLAHKFFHDYYAPFLTLKPVRVLTMIIYVVYVVGVVYCASRMEVNISPHKLVVDDSPLLEYFDLAEHYSWSDSVLAHVFITKSPDFRNKSEIDKFLNFTDKLQNMTEFVDQTASPTDTQGLWLREYLAFLEYVTHITDGYNEDFYDYMPDFLSTPDYKKYWIDMRFKPRKSNSSRLELEKFRFTVFYRGVNTWEKHVVLMKFWRQVCSEYASYDAVVYDHHHLNIYLDQRSTLEPTTLQTSGIAILAMAFITAVFMPDLASVFYICMSFLSVDIGVIGFLGLWKTDLDPVTMVW